MPMSRDEVIAILRDQNGGREPTRMEIGDYLMRDAGNQRAKEFAGFVYGAPRAAIEGMYGAAGDAGDALWNLFHDEDNQSTGAVSGALRRAGQKTADVFSLPRGEAADTIIAETLPEFVPGPADVKAIAEGGQMIGEGLGRVRDDFWGGLGDAGMGGLLVASGVVPVVGDAGRLAARGANEAVDAARASRGRGLRQSMDDEAHREALGRILQGEMPTRGTELPTIRDLPKDEAIELARTQAHLIPATGSTDSAFVGGPRTVQSMEDLERLREGSDARLTEGVQGADWYDRTREDIDLMTGGRPKDNEWASAQHAQWSAGVSPESELGFTLTENNSAIAGKPRRGYLGDQHEAFMRAIQEASLDPMRLFNKTGEYEHKINPNINANTATGTNDFRRAQDLGFVNADGTPWKKNLTPAQHNFADWETALQVDRANANAFGGKTDWSGESAQAAPWVQSKAYDILGDSSRIVKGYLAEGVPLREAVQRALRESPEFRAQYDAAFDEANKTIGDNFPKHTFNATFEAQIGSGPASRGHLPDLQNAPQDVKDAFARDPRSSMEVQLPDANRPLDAIYGDLRIPGTGVGWRTLPTQEMIGRWTNPATGAIEENLGYNARGLTGIHSGDSAFKEASTEYRRLIEEGHDPKDAFKAAVKAEPELYKSIPSRAIHPEVKEMMQAGEALRALIGGQDGGAAHMTLSPGSVSEGVSRVVTLPRPATREDMNTLSRIGQESHLSFIDTVDRGDGSVMQHDFYPQRGTPYTAKQIARSRIAEDASLAAPSNINKKTGLPKDPVYPQTTNMRKTLKQSGAGGVAVNNNVRKQYQDMVQEAFPGATVDSVAVDSIYQDWTAKYAMDNGAATKELLNIFDTLAPGGRAAFNNSEAIPKAALALLERDAEYGKALGGTWDALQNLRQVIGEGPGWLDRLRRGVETGAILPAVGAAFLYQALDGDTSAELRNPDGVTPQNPGQVYGQGA